MDKQEKAQRLLQEVSAGLTALTRAVLHARSVHPFAAPPAILDRVYDHAQRLSTALDEVQARWPAPVAADVSMGHAAVHENVLPPLDVTPHAALEAVSPPEATPEAEPHPVPDAALTPEVTPEVEPQPVPGTTLTPEVTPEVEPHPVLDTALTPEVTPEVEPHPVPDAALTPEATPEVEPQPVPGATPTPEVTPEVEPQPVPGTALTPEATPEVTPEAEPQPVPGTALTPEATPEVTPEAEPHPVSGATPTPEVTPEVEPTPVPDATSTLEAPSVLTEESVDGDPTPSRPVVEPLLLQGDLAPFEPEHDRPQDQDVIAVLPVEPGHPHVGQDEESGLVLTLPIQPLPVGAGPSPEGAADLGPHEHEDPEHEDDDIDEVVDEIQPDVLPIFFDELPELTEAIPVCFDMVRKGQTTYLKNGQETGVVHELHRLLHTLKGNTGMVGAKRARTIIHAMEGMMEEAEAGRLDVAAVVDDLEQRFNKVLLLIAALERGEFDYQLPKRKKAPVTDAEGSATDATATEASDAAGATLAPVISITARGKGVKVNPEMLDRLVNEANEAKLTRSGLESSVATMQGIMRDLDENVQGLIKMLRELEIHAESQIQSRRSQIEETGEEFDPLEFDRFTRLQELARFLSERAHDTLDLQQGASRSVAEQETLLAYQERSINELQDSLTKTRLTPFDSMTDPLVKMTKLAAREEGKEVDVVVVGERTELDRALIEKISTPLQHALRNAVVHGIEGKDDRVRLGKPVKGQITITVRQEAGRVFINVQDDGGGIRVDKVRQKAIERGLWSASATMSDQEAADMVCTPHFSTVDTVSQLAGRGVGMDVVRSDVLALGGRFDLRSVPGQGLTVALQLPTTLSTAATLIVEAQGERVAIPVECIEHVLSMRREDVMLARERGWIEYNLQGDRMNRIDFRYLPAIMGLKVTAIDPPAYNQAVLVRESNIVVAVLVDRLIGTQEVPIRPIGRALSRLPGIVGTTVLSDGHAAFVLDPARTRAAFVKQTAGKVSVGPEQEGAPALVEALETQELPNETDTPRLTASTHRGPPLVMVVDDSLTVRKASARFLQREGYAHALAKDGQEAVEMLATVTPDLILLDVEMPRMDGFDFAKHVREHPRHNAVPIIMITSRIADKHRKRADAIGVNDYLGKPFKEEELLALLQRYTGQEA